MPTAKKAKASPSPMSRSPLQHPDQFARRHIGPRPDDLPAMLSAPGYPSLDGLVDDLGPENIRIRRSLDLPPARSEREALAALRAMAAENEVFRSYIGMGYYDCITPPVIQRNILENPGWYTAYTPYQAEIAQGRLEMLLNFQTMIADLTALPIANASLLDEGTAAAEAVAMRLGVRTPPERWSPLPLTCWPSRCSRPRATGAPTSPSATPSGSACRWGTAARTRRSTPPA